MIPVIKDRGFGISVLIPVVQYKFPTASNRDSDHSSVCKIMNKKSL